MSRLPAAGRSKTSSGLPNCSPSKSMMLTSARMPGVRRAPVEQAHRPRRLPRLAPDDIDEVEALAPGAVANPVGEHRGRETGVADHAHVGAAVGETGHAVRIEVHGPNHVEVALGVIEEGEVQQVAAPVLEEGVVGQCRGLDTQAAGLTGQRLARGSARSREGRPGGRASRTGRRHRSPAAASARSTSSRTSGRRSSATCASTG